MHVTISRPVVVADKGKPRQFDPTTEPIEVSDDTGARLLRTMAAKRVSAPAPTAAEPETGPAVSDVRGDEEPRRRRGRPRKGTR